MSVETNKAAIRRMFDEEVNRGDYSVAKDIVSPDVVMHSNPPDMQHGIEGHQDIIRLWRDAFSDLSWTIEDLVAEGDRVVARTTIRGRHTGDYFGIPPTDTALEITGTHVFRMVDGRIAEHWANIDDLQILQQFGLIPKAAHGDVRE